MNKMKILNKIIYTYNNINTYKYENTFYYRLFIFQYEDSNGIVNLILINLQVLINSY